MTADQTTPIQVKATPAKELRHAAVGDCIYFGRYRQGSDGASAPAPILWRLLAVTEGKALVLAEHLLDCRPYHEVSCDITWEASSLRGWLNGEFLTAAFSPQESEAIGVTAIAGEANPKFATPGGNATFDKIFLLSITEAEQLFSGDAGRMAAWTPYARARGQAASLAQIHPGDSQARLNAERYFAETAGWWWLRTPGLYANSVANVHQLGAVLGYGGDVADVDGGVRPALWLDLPQ